MQQAPTPVKEGEPTLSGDHAQRETDALAVEAPHARSLDEVVRALGVDVETGLSDEEVKRRRHQLGRNELGDHPRVSARKLLSDQVRSSVVVLLLAAAAVGLAIGEVVEAVAVLTVLVVNAIVGFATELRAARSMEALEDLTSNIAEVERADQRDEIDAAELVPGDIVGLDAGEQVPADLRLIEAANLTIEESALTGESLAVGKHVEPLGAEVDLAERRNLAYMGTTVRTGRGRGVVVATGTRTEVGGVARLVESVGDSQAPLQAALERLAQVLSLVVVALTVALTALGLARGLAPEEVLEVAIALAVAVVPEGLPAVATLTLTVGMRRMAARHALVRRLPVVETLGSTTVIASDKTGTLTANRMEVAEVVLANGVDEAELWTSAVLCNDADVAADGDPVGDPTEVALLHGAESAGVDWRALRARHPRDDLVPFDSQTKRMASAHGGTVHVKGAPEVLLGGAEQARLAEAVEAMSGRALRTLALARRPAPDGPFDPEQAFAGLEVLGVVGMDDPPRLEAVAAVEACHRAGIRVVMVTGDQPATAAAVAARLGLRHDDVLTGAEVGGLDDEAFAERIHHVDVYARVTPDQKLRIVEQLQAAGEVVAVTGDGVNDAPALRRADVGVAMGRSGTDVARDAADIVLTNDDFATIEHAIEEGRRVFANIRRFGQFLFSWHLSVVLVVTAGLVFGVEAPLAGLMVLWNNLIIDVLPSFALALEPGGADAMRQPPRPRHEPVLGRGTLRRILAQGALVGSVGLAAFLLGSGPLELDTAEAQTLTFVTLTVAQLLGVFSARTDGAGFAGAGTNPYLWAALGLTLVLEATALAIAPLRDLLGLALMPAGAWAVAMAMAPLPLVVTQLGRRLGIGSMKGATGRSRG